MIHWIDFGAGCFTGALTLAAVLKGLAMAGERLEDKKIAEWEATRDQREIEQAMRQQRVWRLPEEK